MIAKTGKILSLAIAGALVVSACSSDKKAATTTTTGAATTTAATATTTVGDSSTTTAGGAVTATLKGVCPDNIVFGTDWYPEAEHAIYENLGTPYTVSKDAGSVTGPFMFGGKDMGVKITILLGGAAGKNNTATADLYTNPDIFLAMVSSDEAVKLSASKPTISVVAPQDKSPQVLFWDPASHTGKTIAEVAKEVSTVQYFAGASYMDYYLASGVVDPAKADSSYNGAFDKFVANPKTTMTQGFATAEPYQLEHDTAQWMKPVAYQLVHDTGWQVYPEAWATTPDRLAKAGTKDCLKKLVPILQQSQIDVVKDPAAAIKAIVDVNTTYDSFWKYSAEVGAYSIETQKKIGIVANGTGDGLGSFDLKRVNDFIALATPVYTKLGNTPKAGLKAEDIVTNEFIDPKIKL